MLLAFLTFDFDTCAQLQLEITLVTCSLGLPSSLPPHRYSPPFLSFSFWPVVLLMLLVLQALVALVGGA